MIWTLWTRQEIALIAAILALACVAAFFSIKLTRPRPFAGAALSAQWQCSPAAGTPKLCVRKPT
jgi:hypothetical protein